MCGGVARCASMGAWGQETWMLGMLVQRSWWDGRDDGSEEARRLALILVLPCLA